MSAHFVGEAFFAQLARELRGRVDNQENIFYSTTMNWLNLHDVAPNRWDEVIVALVNQLRQLNIRSVASRYGQEEVEEHVGKVVAKMIPGVTEWSDMQYYKYFAYLRYQCCEGECARSKIYCSLDCYTGSLAENIVSETPEYGAAHWSFKG